ncbi:putative ABC transporter permease [Lancefieldella sp. Marseille-Q7238]|uniref:putative ABC transporter permease n=1 Tax=Lancefieldella sp. Marseille-Q7238 TaxID=3022127 RepID=UPI0024A819DA|nr:putative ABC transporter permease [Lancefieldella sp. Marseille-Q7238]
MESIIAAFSGLLAVDLGWGILRQMIPQVILMFAIISVGGWIYETAYCSLVEHGFSRRGFLFGPSCPIYGVGAVSVWITLGSLDNPVLVFVLGGLMATILEYSTGLILERRFHRTWWDYSMFRYNIKGRICPQASLVFGAFSVVTVFFIAPGLLSLFSLVPIDTLNILAGIVGLAYFIDTAASLIYLTPAGSARTALLAQEIRTHIRSRM